MMPDEPRRLMRLADVTRDTPFALEFRRVFMTADEEQLNRTREVVRRHLIEHCGVPPSYFPDVPKRLP